MWGVLPPFLSPSLSPSLPLCLKGCGSAAWLTRQEARAGRLLGQPRLDQRPGQRVSLRALPRHQLQRARPPARHGRRVLQGARAWRTRGAATRRRRHEQETKTAWRRSPPREARVWRAERTRRRCHQPRDAPGPARRMPPLGPARRLEQAGTQVGLAGAGLPAMASGTQPAASASPPHFGR